MVPLPCGMVVPAKLQVMDQSTCHSLQPRSEPCYTPPVFSLASPWSSGSRRLAHVLSHRNTISQVPYPPNPSSPTPLPQNNDLLGHPSLLGPLSPFQSSDVGQHALLSSFFYSLRVYDHIPTSKLAVIFVPCLMSSEIRSYHSMFSLQKNCRPSVYATPGSFAPKNDSCHSFTCFGGRAVKL